MDELRLALELATEAELQELTEILFRRRFNPLDYWQTPDPVVVQSGSHQAWLDALEERFRYLAADGVTVLKGQSQQVTYRQVLLRVYRHLRLPYSPRLSTLDLEAELFLALLQRLWRKLPKADQQNLIKQMETSWAEVTFEQDLPLTLRHDPVRLILEGGTALAFGSLVHPLLQNVVRQLTAYLATRQLTQGVAQGIVSRLPVQLTGELASQAGLATGVGSFGLARGAMACLGTAMWVWFLADLGWRSIATNYARIIPTIFTLAQIRITRAECFNPI